MGTNAGLALIAIAFFGVACGSSTTPAAASSPIITPRSDALTKTYVALIKSYWDAHIAADGVSGTDNVASRACLGTLSNKAPRDESLVEPATCYERGVLILQNQEKFLGDLNGTTAPVRFAADDKIFREYLPMTIVDLEAMNSGAAAANKQATFDAANSYADIMLTWIVDALDDVDPSTRHY